MSSLQVDWSRRLIAVMAALVTALPSHPSGPAFVMAEESTSTAKPPIENLHPLTPRLISGGQPKDDAAFSKLAEMGVQTIVSVDGAKPDLELARKHGLRYVHIPIGYEGVDADAQAALTRVVREAKGPVFVHCHHGKHRGPAAAVIACMAAGDMNREQASEFMKLAGTGREYKGLWRDVAAFKPLPADAKLPPLVEVAQVDSLAGAMADLDRAWDGVKLCQAAAWKTPAGHADLAPAHQALLAWEGLVESRRMARNADPQLGEWLDEVAAEAAQLRQAVQAGDEAKATQLFERVNASCTRCHEQYRN
jgi:protein tyrosine phosphatase (PTP) superfamily phosphohydrolase (DUF442 family)